MCSGWAACYLAPYLATVVATYFYIPETVIWTLVAIVVGLVTRRWRTALIGGLVIGALAWVTLYAVAPSEAVKAQRISADLIPVVTGGMFLTLLAHAIGAGVSLLFKRNSHPTGPLPKI